MRRMILMVILAGLWSTQAHAFSTKYPFVAADCTTTVAPAGLAAAISSAANGNNVCVTSGSVALPAWTQNKDIAIIGPTAWGGSGTATITITGVQVWGNTSAPFAGPRVTGFTLDFGSNGWWYLAGFIGYRFDHNNMTRSVWGPCLNPIGYPIGTAVSPSEGLVDNNTTLNCRFINDGAYAGGGGEGGFLRWSEPLALGTIHNNYYEDNHSSQNDTASIHNFTDGNVGGRYVARFNTLTDTYFEFHSIQGPQRAQRLAEIYGNNLSSGGVSPSRLGLFRGGVGIVFNNTYTGTWPGQSDFDMDNVRSIEDRASSSFGTWGWCEGAGSSGQTLVVDGNADSSGYLCRDQIGASTDAFLWATPGQVGPVPAQQVQPWLIWNNTFPGVPDIKWDYNVSTFPKLKQQIQANRNVFTSSPSPSSNPQPSSCTAGGSCTSGIGRGTTLPTTCTPITDTLAGGAVVGPWFWKTNEGSWNTKLPANTSGVMYKCTATNTFSLFYTPFTYPHPLQLSNDTTPPTAPSSLVATATSQSQINLSWTAATDNVGVTAYLVERCQGVGCGGFAQITSTPTTNIIDTGLTPNTTYQYRVRATDAASNLGPYSNTANATTFAVDTTPPTVPTNLVATGVAQGEIDLTWTASTDNVAVTGYQILRCNGTGCTPTAQSQTNALFYHDFSVACGSSFTYAVTAFDASGNISAPSATAVGTTLSCITPPFAPTGLTLQAVSDFSRDKGSWSWAQGGGPAADGFHLKCGKVTTERSLTVDVPTTATTTLFVRQFLPGQGKWFCTVVAYNAGGESTEAAEANTNVIGPGFGAWGFSY